LFINLERNDIFFGLYLKLTREELLAVAHQPQVSIVLIRIVIVSSVFELTQEKIQPKDKN
jgi:hypothetical protein